VKVFERVCISSSSTCCSVCALVQSLQHAVTRNRGRVSTCSTHTRGAAGARAPQVTGQVAHRLLGPASVRALHTLEKVPAPWRGRVNEQHYDKIVIENMLTSIASTPPCRAMLYCAITSISNVSSRSRAIRSVVPMCEGKRAEFSFD
jgi:hypothetical protein